MPTFASWSGLLTFACMGLLAAFLARLSARWVGQHQWQRTIGKRMRILEGVVLGKDQRLFLLQVGKRIFLIGASGQQISVLHSADEAEAASLLDAAVTADSAEGESPAPTADVRPALLWGELSPKVRAAAQKGAAWTRDRLWATLQTAGHGLWERGRAVSRQGAQYVMAARHKVSAWAASRRERAAAQAEATRGALERTEANLMQLQTVLAPAAASPTEAPSSEPRDAVEPAGSRGVNTLVVLLVAVSALVGLSGQAVAASAEELILPTIEISTRAVSSPQEGLQVMQLLLLLTVLSVAPAILLLTTGFTRIIIVLSFARQAMGTPQLPPNPVLIGLALFLTVAVMAPTYSTVNTVALQPYLRGEISQVEALERASEPVKEFMLKQTREKDLALLLKVMNAPQPEKPEDIPFLAVVPAFALSELKTAFTMGFVLFLAFTIIDLVVASTLMSMGMMMLPPTMISLPFKIILFVVADGWHLIIKSLFESFVG